MHGHNSKYSHSPLNFPFERLTKSSSIRRNAIHRISYLPNWNRIKQKGKKREIFFNRRSQKKESSERQCFEQLNIHTYTARTQFVKQERNKIMRTEILYCLLCHTTGRRGFCGFTFFVFVLFLLNYHYGVHNAICLVFF